jgi:hypothetical protein
MLRTGAILGGLAGGILGAAAWAALAYFANLEVGWIAWGIGLLVGLGVLIGNGRERSHAAGVVAVVLSVLSIVAGKYASVQIAFTGSRSPFNQTLSRIDSDTPFVVSYLADSVAEAYQSQGRAVDWPGNPDDTRDEPSDYPPDVWSAAQARWDAMSPEGQAAYRDALRQQTSEMASVMQQGIMMQAFKGTFGALDLVFLGLAIVTAWRIAAQGSEPKQGPDQTQ